MEVSDISLSSDWDIVNTNSSSSLEDENVKELLEEEQVPVEQTTKLDNQQPKGSSVDDVHLDDNCPCDSNSSSDVDVIEEVVHGSKYTESPKIHPMEYSISSSLEGSTTSMPSLPKTKNEESAQKTENKYVFLNLQLDLFDLTNITSKLKEHYVMILFSLVLTTVLMYMGSSTEDNIKKMIAQVNALKAENTDLKNKVLSKIEDDKLFIALEDQITNLKDENFKLSSSLQALIQQLEQQTTIFQKENQKRKKDPYKTEIEKLKQQVNMLKIDNDDLQTQLVRMRYSMHSPHTEETKKHDNSKKEKVELNEDKNDSASEFLSVEIKDLKKKLFSEVEKLKDWKESINHIVKKLSKHSVNEKQDSFTGEMGRSEDKKSDEDGFRKDKTRKFYDWSWKDLKKNFKGTLDSLPNINVSEMFNIDQKKMKGVFESVGHYFKKAQEKTQKILNYDEGIRNEFWEVLGDLRKKWDTTKAEFFENTFNKATFYETEGSQPNNEGKKPSEYEERKPNKHFNEEKVDERHNTYNSPNMENPDLQGKTEQEQPPTNSWMFKRAAYRSEVRENVEDGEEEDQTNWFLRRKQLNEEPVYEE